MPAGAQYCLSACQLACCCCVTPGCRWWAAALQSIALQHRPIAVLPVPLCAAKDVLSLAGGVLNLARFEAHRLDAESCLRAAEPWGVSATGAVGPANLNGLAKLTILRRPAAASPPPCIGWIVQSGWKCCGMLAMQTALPNGRFCPLSTLHRLQTGWRRWGLLAVLFALQN